MKDETYDLCIVGAGVFGSAAAKYASTNPNLKICLIGLAEPTEEEMKDREIFSSHWDHGRLVKVLFELPSYQVLARKTAERFTTIEKLSGLKFFHPVGAMYIGKRSSRFMKQLEDTSAWMGTKITRLMDFQKELYPFFHLPENEYGILNTDGGTVNPIIMIEAQKTIAQQQGCQILVDQVNQIHKLEDNVHKIETTKHGEIKARRVLITSGAFTNFSHFEVKPPMEIWIYREKATMLKISDSEAKRLSIMPGIVYRRNEEEIGFYMLPPVKYPDGYYMKIGSMMGDSGRGLQDPKEVKEYLMSEMTPEEIKKTAERLFELIPDLKTEELHGKICVTSETPTGFPYIDQVSPTVTVAVAACGWGVTTGDEIGRLAAGLSLTGQWDSSIPRTLFEIIPNQE